MSGNDTINTNRLSLPNAPSAADVTRVTFTGAPMGDGALEATLISPIVGRPSFNPTVTTDLPDMSAVQDTNQQTFPCETSTSMMGLPSKAPVGKPPVANLFNNVPTGHFPMYKCYPAGETSFVRSQGNFPECNGEAVKIALKNLQEKIFNLEKEKNEALSSLSNLNAEAKNKQLTFSTQSDRTFPFSEAATTNEISDLTMKLSNAEIRCLSLDRYLHDLKRSFEEYFGINFEDSSVSGIPPFNNDRRCQSQNIGASSLNTEKNKLLSIKAQSERKIRDLEARLQQERRYKRMVEEKSLELDDTSTTYHSLPKPRVWHSTPISDKSNSHKKKWESPNIENATLNQSLMDSNSDLTCLLSQLQEEFELLKSHYNNMQQMMVSTSSSDLQNSIRKEIEDAQIKIHLKIEQIKIVTKIIKQVDSFKDFKEESANGGHSWNSCDACSKSATIPVCENDRRVQILTTITACGRASLQTSCPQCQKNDS